MTWVALETPPQGLDAIGGPGLGGIGDPSPKAWGLSQVTNYHRAFEIQICAFYENVLKKVFLLLVKMLT